MNDRWIDAASAVADEAEADLARVLAALRAVPVHSPAGTALAARAGDLRHRLAAARRVLDAFDVGDTVEEAAA